MKYFKYFFILLFLVIFIFLFDMTKFNFKYENKNLIEISERNLNSNYLKKIYNYFNLKYESFLIKYSKNHRKYWLVEDAQIRKLLPDTKKILAGNVFTKNKFRYEENHEDWHRSHGNSNSNRFSNLNLINRDNVNKLKIAWIYESKDRHESRWGFDIQCNPIVAKGKIYTPTVGGYIVAINGYNGKEIWRSKKFKDDVARRGLIYWTGNESHKQRIYFSNHNFLVALDAETGKLISSFGKKGKIKTGPSKVAPIIYKNSIIIVTFNKTLEIYDLVNGKTKSIIYFGEKNNERNGGKKYDPTKGGNPWGGFSADLGRGIAYITTGNPYSYFDGTRRPGPNRYSNSIIAVDLNNKKILWDFQETSHDIWNLDIPAPPILTSIIKNNEKIDVVVVPTKRANTIILDRVTGEPVFDLIYRKAPTSILPGEKTSAYQLDLQIPEPFAKNVFSKGDLWSHDSSLLKEHIKKYEKFKYGFFQTYDLGLKNLQYNFHGGAEWMGASIDHNTQSMFVTANNIPWIAGVEQINNKYDYKSYFKRLTDSHGYPGVKPPWGILAALNLNTGKLLWKVPFGEYMELTKKGITKTGTENFGGATATRGNVVFATGTLDEMIYAFDSLTGEELWKKKIPYIGSAPPTIYSINNEQFVIVQSTGSHSLRSAQKIQMGDAIVAFKLVGN